MKIFGWVYTKLTVSFDIVKDTDTVSIPVPLLNASAFLQLTNVDAKTVRNFSNINQNQSCYLKKVFL